MQSLTKKIFLLALTFSTICPSNAEDKYIESQFITADSLYQEKTFKQCINIYEGTLNESLSFSEKSLIQMSSIYFASNDTAKSLQTLEILYKHYPNSLSLEKINELTLKIENSNFVNTDKYAQALPYFNVYRNKILFGLLTLACCFLFLWLAFYFLHQKNKKGLIITGTFFLILTLSINNISNNSIYAVTKSKICFIRTEPSNASSIISQTKNYRKFKVVDYSDIWIKVELDEGYGFIKKSQLLFII